MTKIAMLAIIMMLTPAIAHADRFQVNDRTPGHENETVEIRRVEPVLICSPDMSCVGFNEQQVQPEVETGPIVTAPSGGIRWMIGVAGAQAFDNASLGIQAAVEIPFSKRFEIDLSDTLSPFESHVSLGHGRANLTVATGRVWFGSWGLNGGAEDSMYDVTKVTKDADYAFGGVTKRAIVGGMPARFSFDYIRQFNNGITSTGLESSHLQGFDFSYTMRFGCWGRVCIRNSEDFIMGRVLTQSNPQCDGTFGITGGPGGGPCYRTGAFGGGVKASVMVEFPRRRATENLVF